MSENMPLQAKIQAEVAALATSIADIVQKFKGLHHPLAESKEKVPVATQQLDKISEQTEAATHQMLDMVEQIQVREEKVIDGLTKMSEISELTEPNAASGLISELKELAQTNLNDAYTIMDALQFQDITAQQMNHAASLLEDIEVKLQSIMAIMAGKSVEEVKASYSKDRVFDPNADLFDKRTDQEAIDSLFSKNK